MPAEAGSDGDRLARDPGNVGGGDSQTFSKSPSTYGDEFCLTPQQEPETPDEELFVQNFGAQLKQIHQTLVRYRSTKSLGLVNSAYCELYKVRRLIARFSDGC
jgi:ribosomal protein L29